MCINGTYVVGYPIVYQMHIMNEGVIFGPVITKSNTIKHDRNENRNSKFKTFGVSTCSNIRNFVYYFFCAQIMSFVKPVVGGQQALKFSRKTIPFLYYSTLPAMLIIIVVIYLKKKKN